MLAFESQSGSIPSGAAESDLCSVDHSRFGRSLQEKLRPLDPSFQAAATPGSRATLHESNEAALSLNFALKMAVLRLGLFTAHAFERRQIHSSL